jgi:hypothetical protein
VSVHAAITSSFLRHIVLPAMMFLAAGCAAPVIVEWSTESEMNTAGFNLYRSEFPGGPFSFKVNDQLIPASSDPLAGSNYSFLDRAARPGRTYYYQLQEVERTGDVNLYGPIAVRANGLDWRHAAVLVLLAAIVLIIWIGSGRGRKTNAHDP